jgi:pSer/pThr/pTyr-binding forkhead associated (FHA) protein
MARALPGLLTFRHTDGTEDRFRLQQDVTTIGRSSSCTIAIPLPVISRLHARIEQHERYILFDAGSANGTFVNGKRIDGGWPLTSGDQIALGAPDVVLLFTDPEATLVIANTVAVPPLFIDEDAHSVAVYNVPAQLSPLEYSLLVHFAANPGAVCTREKAFLAVWDQPYDHATCEDALNACIAKLRRNLKAAAHIAGKEPPQITTVQRVGFRLDTEVVFARQRSSAH